MLQWLLPDVGSSSVSIPQAVWIACNEKIVHAANRGDFVSIPQAVWIACNYSLWGKCHSKFSVSIPQAVWIACNPSRTAVNGPRLKSFQYRKRYGLHAIGRRATKFLLKAYEFQYRKRYGLHAISFYVLDWREATLFQYRKRYGLHAIIILFFEMTRHFVSIPQAVWIACNAAKNENMVLANASFNTASGMDCMQYRPSQPLGQLNPEAGFLNGALFLANRRKLAGFFCRQKRLKTSVNPVISRKLLSTEKA